MQSWKVFLATLLIFGTGVATGFFLFNKPPAETPDPASKPPERKAGQTIQIFRPTIAKLKSNLRLSADQVDKIRTLYAASRDRMKTHVIQARKGAQTHLNKNMQAEQLKLNTAIQAVLDETQFAKYKQLPGMSMSSTPSRPAPPDPPQNSNATTPAANATDDNNTPGTDEIPADPGGI